MADSESKGYRILRARLRPWLLLAGCLFFIFFIYKSWNETSDVFLHINWPLFYIAVLLGVGDNVLFSLLFRYLLRKHGLELAYSDVGRMYFFGQLAKYIPGRFWNILYHTTFSDLPGTARAILAANLDLTVMAIFRNAVLALALALVFINLPLAVGLFLLSAFLFYLLGSSTFTKRIIKWLTRIFPRLADPAEKPVSGMPAANVILLYCASWCAFLASNFLVLTAAFNFEIQHQALLIGWFSLAWIIGVVSFIVPAGMGVRELVFIVLAGNWGAQGASLEYLTAIAIVYRLWQVCHEVGGVLVGLILNVLQSGNTASETPENT